MLCPSLLHGILSVAAATARYISTSYGDSFEKQLTGFSAYSSYH